MVVFEDVFLEVVEVVVVVIAGAVVTEDTGSMDVVGRVAVVEIAK